MEKEKLLAKLEMALIYATKIYIPKEIKKAVYENGREDEAEELLKTLREIVKIKEEIYESNLKLVLQPLTEDEIKEKEVSAEKFQKEQEEDEKAEKELKTLLSKVQDFPVQKESVKNIILSSCWYLDRKSQLGFDCLDNAPFVFWWMCRDFCYKNSLDDLKTAIEFVHKFYLAYNQKAKPELFLNTYRFLGDNYMKECFDFFKMSDLEKRKVEDTPYLKMEKIILDQVKND